MRKKVQKRVDIAALDAQINLALILFYASTNALKNFIKT